MIQPPLPSVHIKALFAENPLWAEGLFRARPPRPALGPGGHPPAPTARSARPRRGNFPLSSMTIFRYNGRAYLAASKNDRHMSLISNDLISSALSTATDTELFLAGEGSLSSLPAAIGRVFPDGLPFLVADETTWAVAGAKAAALLREADIACAGTLVFPARPRPIADEARLRMVREALERGGPSARAVAIGSGTINDLCKRASEELGRPYLCIATAASVDGYASFGAPITKDGFKSTWPCAAPKAILADSAILRTAPMGLTASGYADLAAKITGGADWILADKMGLDPIRDDVWETTQIPLRGWLAEPAALVDGDPGAMTRLITGLAMTGFAMQTTHTSRPASGAEHLFSHVWEMWGVTRPDGEHPSHGEKVGIGTLCVTRMLTSFFDRPFKHGDIDPAIAAYPPWDRLEARVRELFGPTIAGDRAVEASRAKYPSREELRRRLAILASDWEGLAARIKAQLIPFENLREIFREARCPTTPGEIGVRCEDVPSCALAAQLIRNRYTILDLALDAGRLETLADDLRTNW